jgi:predicted RNA-binding protein with RPS1 domain
MPQPQQQQHQPQVGSIERGTVQRIEAYGAFVALEKYRLRGLIHISQLANCKVEKVDDCVSLNDIIYVKILEIDRDDQGRPKIRLSLKDASQDGTCQDLGQERDQHMALSQQIQQELQSTIGMGVALDPMAKTNLILKSANRSATIINGYALVDDTEGEAPRAPMAPVAAAAVPAMASMGRGRGTTLPAWMTHQLDGPIKVNANDHDPKPTATSSSSKHLKKEKKSKRTVERKHRKRDKEHSSDNENYRHRRKHRRRRNGDDDDDDSSRDRRSKRRGENHKSSSSRRSRRSQSSDDSDRDEFQNVEQAKRLIAELEAKKAAMNT